jgi:hypothetical protein
VPELVSWEPDGKFAQGLAYDRVSALTVEAIKEQQKQIGAQRKQMEAMQSENAELRAVLTEVLTRLAQLEANLRNGR